MAGTLVGVRFGTNANESWNAGDRRIDGEHSAVYVIQTASESEREDVVLETSGLPEIGDKSTVVDYAFCKSRTCTEIGSNSWEVEVSFDNHKSSEKGTDDPDDKDPWNRFPVWSWGSETIEVPLIEDAQAENKPFVNSAGDPFPPALTPVSLAVLTIKKATLNFRAFDIPLFVNHVNNKKFWFADPGQAYFADMRADPTKHDNQWVWDVTYVIKFKIDAVGWSMKILDQGTRHFEKRNLTSGSSSTGLPYEIVKVPFGDDAFQQELGNLDGKGYENKTDVKVFLDFERFPAADFNVLKLGPW